MYSSSVRGRSPASYWTSSSTRAAVRQTIVMIIFISCPEACAQRLLERSRPGAAVSALVDRLLGRRPLVAEIHAAPTADRRAADPPATRLPGAGPAGLHGRGQPILQLEADPLGGLLADAGNGGQPRDVLRPNRADQSGRLDPGQHRQRELRADPADRDQPLEQILLERGGKAVERDARPRARACGCAAPPSHPARRARRTSTAAPARRSRRR